ncbi:MAG TPA: site-specific integrase [Candidatus Dormibacteraeota bacterium]
MKRRHHGNGEGSVYPRSDGRWGATVRLANGRRHTVYAKTRLEAKRRLRELIDQREAGILVGNARQKTADYLERWLEEIARPSVRGSTYIGYRRHIHRVLPRIGHLRLLELSPAHIQSTYRELLAEGLSATTVRHIHAVLHRAFKQAVLWGLLLRNPTDAVSRPRTARFEIKTLSADEVRQFLDANREDRLYALWLLMATTGLRRGEAIAVGWADLDQATSRLSIHRALRRHPHAGLVFEEPKTRHSRRTIQLSALAVAAIANHRRRQLEERLAAGPYWQDCGLIFSSTEGTPLDPHNVYVAFQRALQRTKSPRMRLHDLRHTAATLMLGRGVHPKLVQDMLGHSTISLTMDTYSHVTPPMQGEVASQMDELLG